MTFMSLVIMAVVLLVGLVVIAGIVIAIVMLARRSSRQPQPQWHSQAQPHSQPGQPGPPFSGTTPTRDPQVENLDDVHRRWPGPIA